HFAGLFYLVGRVLEIELAERLWAAGIQEGDVLAHIAATILGTVDDPAWAYFGGAFEQQPRSRLVEPWAVTEVVETVQHSLGRRLVRFGVTVSPETLGNQLDQLACTLVSPVVLDPTLSRVVSRGAAALCVLVGARLGRPPSLENVRAVCARR